MGNSFHSIRIVDHGQMDNSHLKIFHEALHNIKLSGDKNRENYNLDRLDLENHLVFDLLVDSQGELVTFCGIYNGGRYPSGVYRVLNRVYVAPKYRSISKFSAYASRFLLKKQIEDYKSVLDFIFVSRQGKNAHFFLEKWSSKWAPFPGWKVSSELIQVAPGWDFKSFHYIAYFALRSVVWRPNSISAKTINNKLSISVSDCVARDFSNSIS